MSFRNFLSYLLLDPQKLVFYSQLLILLIMTASQKYNYFIYFILNVCHISFLSDLSKSDQSISIDIDSVVKLQYKVKVELYYFVKCYI
jgi:hypothetical protein